MSKSERAYVRSKISRIRRDFPFLPAYVRPAGLDDAEAELEEFLGLCTQIFELLPPDERDSLVELAHRSLTEIRAQWEKELKAGSRTAGRMILGLFSDTGGAGN